MRYYFRADGNAATGAGHLMRCLTIADALQALPGPDPADICFLCADEASGALAEAGGTEPWCSIRITVIWRRSFPG